MGVNVEEATVPVDGPGSAITVRVVRPDGAVLAPGLLPALLFVHGWESSRESYRDRSLTIAGAAGVVVAAMDLRGHGSSSGDRKTASRADHLADVRAAYDHLAGLPEVDQRSVCVAGSSYGGYLTLRLSAERPLRGLILRAPALYADAGFTVATASLIAADPDVFRVPGERAQEVAPEHLAMCRQDKGPVLIVLSGDDRDVPRTTTQAYIDEFGRRTVGTLDVEVIDGAGHVLTPEEKEYFAGVVLRWLAQVGERGDMGDIDDVTDTMEALLSVVRAKKEGA